MQAKGIFFNIPGYGHVNPTLPMIKELVDRGAEVHYCCTEEFRPMIERTGAKFIPLPAEVVYATNEAFNLLKIFADLLEHTYDVMPQLEQLMKTEGYDYILADMYTPWGRMLSDRLNLPLMTFFPSFALHPKLKEPKDSPVQILKDWRTSLPSGWRLFRGYKKLQKAYGTPKVSVLAFLNGEINNPCLTFTAPEFQPQKEVFPANYLFTGPNINTSVRLPDDTFPMERLEGKNVIYISLGSVVVKRSFIRTCIDAFKNTNYLVVLNISKQYEKASFPETENIILCNFAPQLEILPKAALFITHGGMNSTHEGIYFEVPLLVVPQGGDQFLVAQTVEQHGLGKRLNEKGLTAKKLLRLTEQILKDKKTKKNVQKMSQALKQSGGYKKAADEVQTFVQKNIKKQPKITV